ncbi:MAG: hypothetical protein HDKAJFGB_03127 [Anaerolineae bacterium]|nr:hypothetical protein [Anaerolineae bacterium]
MNCGGRFVFCALKYRRGMKRKYVILLGALVLGASGIFGAALMGILPARDVPFALGTLAAFGALLFGYTALRLRDE